MKHDAFEQQLSRGLDRLVAEADIPDLTSEQLLEGKLLKQQPHRAGRRRATFLAVAASAAMVLTLGTIWVSGDRNESDIAAKPDELNTQGDPLRDINQGSVGTAAPRYVRSWTRTESGSRVDVVMTEQWFAPDGRVVVRGGSVEPLSGDRWVDPGFVHGAEVEQFASDPPDADPYFGYPELALAARGVALEDLAASPPDQELGVFVSVSNMGGESSYVTGETAATVRTMTRFVPTLMDATARAEVLQILTALPDSSTSSLADDLGRPSTKLSIPLTMVDPSSGAVVGRFEVGFWFDSTTNAPHQIEWHLAEGVLGGTEIDTYRETVVIVAAGEVATIPDPAGDYDSETTVTTQAPDGELGLRPESEIERVQSDMESTLRIADTAKDVLIQECMEGEGFEFYPYTGRTEADTSVSLFTDPESWDPATNGYYPAPTEHNSQPDLQGVYLATLTPTENEAYGQAFFGTETVDMQFGSMAMSIGTDGCLGDARTEVTGADPESTARIWAIPSFISVLIIETQLLVEADPEFQVAVENWRTCMSNEGFNFENPADAIEAADRAFQRDPSEPPSGDEVVQASTDRRCQLESRTADVYQQRFVFHEATLTARGDGQELIAEWNRARDQLLQRSNAILSDAGATIGE